MPGSRTLRRNMTQARVLVGRTLELAAADRFGTIPELGPCKPCFAIRLASRFCGEILRILQHENQRR
jgi:hypothetical protein